MKEITKKAIKFTDISRDIVCEKLLESLYDVKTSLCTVNSSQEPKYKLKYYIGFASGVCEVSKEDYDWCVDYLKAKAGKNEKTPQSDKIGTFKIDGFRNLIWKDATYGHTVFTAEQVEAIKFLIDNELR